MIFPALKAYGGFQCAIHEWVSVQCSAETRGGMLRTEPPSEIYIHNVRVHIHIPTLCTIFDRCRFARTLDVA